VWAVAAAAAHIAAALACTEVVDCKPVAGAAAGADTELATPAYGKEAAAVLAGDSGSTLRVRAQAAALRRPPLPHHALCNQDTLCRPANSHARSADTSN
jgi:hypothetical protein